MKCRLLIWIATAALVPAQVTFAQSVVGVLGIEEEIIPFEKRLADVHEVRVQGYVFRVGTLGGREVVVGRSGAGKVNAAIVATLMVGHFKPVAILFTGTAGAVDADLYPGDVVLGKAVAQHDVGLETALGLRRRGLRNPVTAEVEPVLVPAPEMLLDVARSSIRNLKLSSAPTSDGVRQPRIVEGVIVTGDAFLADPARREELRRVLGATAIEMEGAAVIQTCRQFTVACLIVRSVTDRADTQAVSSYQQNLEAASRNAASVVESIIGGLPGGKR